MSLKQICNYIIQYSFYSLFLLVPLIFTPDTSELFELPKMWFTWGLTTIIMTAWITKMIATRSFRIQKTPLDIPLLLFLSSQIIATLFSLDQRISIWGYYSRFNGGLLSTIAYVLLYYAFVSNLNKKHVFRSIYISLISVLLVCLWGFPSHYGVDPTCFVVRGSFDISCWTEQFVPTVRVFSTLGQPAWFAAYLSILLPVSLALFIMKEIDIEKKKDSFSLSYLMSLSPLAICYFLLSLFIYICIIFSNTRAGFLGFLLGYFFFWLSLIVVKRHHLKRYLTLFFMCSFLFLVSNFFFGIPVNQLQNYTIGYKIQESIIHKDTAQKPAPIPTTPLTPQEKEVQEKNKQIESSVANITDSGNIRKNVWRGAIDAWKASPVFGTGVETFAFSYYKHKPVEQNYTSEWDFLYNKAHNEYLNYLATTGIYGLGTYLLFIGWFGYLLFRKFYKHEEEIGKEHVIVIGLVAGFITMLFSNFFGFSVVIVNVYLFLIPAFAFILLGMIKKPGTIDQVIQGQKTNQKHHASDSPSLLGWTGIAIAWVVCFYILYLLVIFFNADKAYALGYNLNRVGQYDKAFPKLYEAYMSRKSEPVFQDELSYNAAVLASAYAAQKDEKNAQQYLQLATMLSEQLATAHPNNIVFLKNRVRMLYELSKINPQYIGQALQTILRAYELSPNDAKIAYNAGVLLGQTGQVVQGIDVLERAGRLKPDFRDVFFALALFYRDQATNGGKTVVNQEKEEKAESNLRYILERLNPNDKQAQDLLSSWGITP